MRPSSLEDIRPLFTSSILQHLQHSHSSNMAKTSFLALLLSCTASLTSADFHILYGRDIHRGALDITVVSYAPSNQYNCDWVGGFQPNQERSLGKTSIQYPTDVTFTSPVPICGVENMVFHNKDSGGFDLTDDNGPAGECYPNGGYGAKGLFCHRDLVFTWDIWDEYYICYSYACQGRQSLFICDGKEPSKSC